MIVNTRAIVLNHVRYGESSLVVHLYTEQLGRQAVFVKGAFGKKSQLKASLFQPLYLIETSIHHWDKRQMQRISNIRVLQPFHDILMHPIKSSIALFIAEALTKTIREEDANKELFAFLSHSLQTLNLMKKGTANFHLIFLIHLTRYLGFYPNLQEFSADMPDFVTHLMTLSFEHIETLEISHSQRNQMMDYILSYYALHVDNFGKMKSFMVLQQVFKPV
ncbi:MAG: DNA repair protein RecO [Bacteroidales bacterium]|jgi:DNA repair protein RecO (recombination protein O)|nr:DNA repair protein RecO [Bacteroidales bacterium]